MKNSLKISTPTDREIVMTRDFDAPRKLVWDAWTQPELVKRWLGVQGGWTLALCEIDLRVGGRSRYVWRNAEGGSMGLTLICRELIVPEKIVSTERFDEAWYPGEAVGTLLFVERAGKTTLTQTIRYQSKEVRDMVLKTPMERGVSASYDLLDVVLTSLARSS